MILLKLILAHLIGDFLLQPKLWVNDKEAKKLKSARLYIHLFIHAVLIVLLLWDISYWLLAIIIALLHGVVDVIKLYRQKPSTRPAWFLIDQCLHLIIILVVYICWFQPELIVFQILDEKYLWVYATALLFVTVVSGIIIQVFMQKWSVKFQEKETFETKAGTSLKDAGKYIGILERLCVFIFIVANHWEGVGFLMAAKSIFRFGDLKESKDIKLTEYILIGTLFSFTLAILTALAVNAIIKWMG